MKGREQDEQITFYGLTVSVDVAWPKEDEPSGFSSDFGGRPNRPQNRQQSRARTGAAASNAETSVIRPYSDRTALPSSGQSNLNRRLQSRRNNYGERRNSAVMLGFA